MKNIVTINEGAELHRSTLVRILTIWENVFQDGNDPDDITPFVNDVFFINQDMKRNWLSIGALRPVTVSFMLC